MATLNEIEGILNRIAEGKQTDADIAKLGELLRAGDVDSVRQLGKYNIGNIRADKIDIGDRTYQAWTEEAIQALIRAIRDSQEKDNYLGSDICSDRQSLERYLDVVLERIKQQGCLDIRQNQVFAGRKFNYIARIVDSEFRLSVFPMRGETFFFFSEFASIETKTLDQFSGQCMQLAREQANPGSVWEAVYNAKMPSNICFAVAIADRVDKKVAEAVQSTNPFNRKVDPLWYEIPAIYDLSQQRLFFYEKVSNVFDYLLGAGVWKELRSIIRQVLIP